MWTWPGGHTGRNITRVNDNQNEPHGRRTQQAPSLQSAPQGCHRGKRDGEFKFSFWALVSLRFRADSMRPPLAPTPLSRCTRPRPRGPRPRVASKSPARAHTPHSEGPWTNHNNPQWLTPFPRAGAALSPRFPPHTASPPLPRTPASRRSGQRPTSTRPTRSGCPPPEPRRQRPLPRQAAQRTRRAFGCKSGTKPLILREWFSAPFSPSAPLRAYAFPLLHMHCSCCGGWSGVQGSNHRRAACANGAVSVWPPEHTPPPPRPITW